MTTCLSHLDKGIKHQCILEIFRSQGTIMVRVEKNGKAIAFGEGRELSVALEKADVAYLKLFDKYAAQIARYDNTITNSNKSGTLTDSTLTEFIKNGGCLYIQRKEFFPALIATASNWDGNIVCKKSAPDLACLLKNLFYSLK
jgi:hypothetical protein